MYSYSTLKRYTQKIIMIPKIGAFWNVFNFAKIFRWNRGKERPFNKDCILTECTHVESVVNERHAVMFTLFHQQTTSRACGILKHNFVLTFTYFCVPVRIYSIKRHHHNFWLVGWCRIKAAKHYIFMMSTDFFIAQFTMLNAKKGTWPTTGCVGRYYCQSLYYNL